MLLIVAAAAEIGGVVEGQVLGTEHRRKEDGGDNAYGKKETDIFHLSPSKKVSSIRGNAADSGWWYMLKVCFYYHLAVYEELGTLIHP
jgi:endonuclease I